MGSLNDIYELTQKFTTQGQEAYARFYYEQTSTLGDAFSCHTAYVAYVFPYIEDAISDDTFLTGDETVNLSDPGDFFKVTYAPVAGDRPSSALSPFNALGFIYGSPDRRIRSGGKRFPGAADDDFTDGVPSGTMLVILQALATVLGDIIRDGTKNYEPVLWTPGNIATSFAPLALRVANVVWARLTTQSSRKSF